MTNDRKIVALGVIAVLLVLALGGFWLKRSQSEEVFAQCRRSVVTGGLDSFGVPFTLTDQTGKRVTDTEVFAKPALVYFGYTFCPDVCPLDAARNASAVDILAENGKDVTPVFISVDPARDTLEVLGQFTEAMSPKMVGLTGSTEEIAKVVKGWRGYYKLNNQDDKENYLVDHTTQTYLVMPGKGTVEFFNRDTSPEEMASRVGCFVDAAS